MARTAERTQISAAEYLAWERAQEMKHEFFHGEVFALAGGSLRHNALGSRLQEALRVAFRGRGCEVFSSDQKVGLGGRYVYPDATVACGPVIVEPSAPQVLLSPRVIVEVLSETTEQYDRGLKWEGYQCLPSLADYLLISQAEVRIEQFRREAHDVWAYRAHGPGGRVVLTDGSELDVDAIFAGVFDLPGD